VIDEQFCLVDTYGDGLYELYHRCP